MPKCVGSQCQLPELGKGEYLGGIYKAGQYIPHKTVVEYTCPR